MKTKPKSNGVTRYTPCQRWHTGRTMAESPDGEYVLASDYQAFRETQKRLTDERKATIARLKEDYQKLREYAGDALTHLASHAKRHPELFEPSIDEARAVLRSALGQHGKDGKK